MKRHLARNQKPGGDEAPYRLTDQDRAWKYISKIPGAISGQAGHNTTFRVAAVLVQGFALSEAAALRLLGQWNRSCVPPWSEAELRHKITSAANVTHREGRGYLLGKGGPRTKVGGPRAMSGMKKVAVAQPVSLAAEKVSRPVTPKFCPMVLKRIAAKVEGIANVVDFIRRVSPVPVETQDSASVLRQLYRPGLGEKILIFSGMKSQGQFLWEADRSAGIQNRHLPRGPEGVWFLAQPVDGKYHPNPRENGKLSRRSEESVTRWRYVVLESDKADADDWLRCLVQLPLRIVCITESAGTSIHALVRLDARSKANWDALISEIKPALVTLGADPCTLSAVRLTRLPQAQRGERVQRLLYLNPASNGTPIVRLGNAMEAAV